MRLLYMFLQLTNGLCITYTRLKMTLSLSLSTKVKDAFELDKQSAAFDA